MPGQENTYQFILAKIRLVRDAGGRLKVRRWLPPLVWAGVILFVTSLPQNVVPQQLSVLDKVAHFSLYGIFGVLLYRHISDLTSARLAAMLTLVIAIAFAAVDEWHQQYIPGRSTELADWYADSLGAAAGVAYSALARRRRTSTE